MTNERVPFRYIVCPKCAHNLCWVNLRLPSYCPECGKHIYPEVRAHIYVSDPNAELRYDANANQDVDVIANGKFARPNQ